jgi:hypothetical protein
MTNPIPMTADDRRKRDIEMFGCTEEQATEGFNRRFGPAEIYVASILSDAQEVLAMGNAETARQFMNKAKHCLFLMLDAKMATDGAEGMCDCGWSPDDDNGHEADLRGA